MVEEPGPISLDIDPGHLSKVLAYQVSTTDLGKRRKARKKTKGKEKSQENGENTGKPGENQENFGKTYGKRRKL